MPLHCTCFPLFIFTTAYLIIPNLVSANFKITMEGIKKTRDEIKILGKEVRDLRSSLEFTENVLEKKVKKLEKLRKHGDRTT